MAGIRRTEPGSNRAVVDATELTMLLDEIDLSRVKRPVLWTPPSHPTTTP